MAGLLPIAAIPAVASMTEAGFTFTIENGSVGYGAYVTDYSGGTDPVVPAQLGGVDVVSVELNQKNLTSLDVSACAALTWLNCGNNQLTELDVTKNTALIYLMCYSNRLTTLDVSQNTALINFNCYWNQLTELDVSANTALFWFGCAFNRMGQDPDVSVIGWRNHFSVAIHSSEISHDRSFVYFPQGERPEPEPCPDCGEYPCVCFGPVPATGIPDMTAPIAGMVILLLISAGLWGYVLRRRVRSRL